MSLPDGKFKYLAGLVPVIVFEWIFILSMFYLSRYYCKCCNRDHIPNEELDDQDGTPSSGIEKRQSPCDEKELRFEDTFESFHPGMKYLLMVTRFGSLCYICGVSVIANYTVRNSFTWFYFTTWNVELISIYFIFAFTCSVIGIASERKNNSSSDLEGGLVENRPSRVIWSKDIINFGNVTHVLFEVCGATAILVTLVAFILLNPEFKFWNVTVHFINICVMLLDLSLNNMYVRLDHIPYNLTWAFFYVIFAWSIVVRGNIDFWPYAFLKLDTYYCFFWYTGLIIIDIVLFLVFYCISLAKFYLRQSFNVPVKVSVYDEFDENYENGSPVLPRQYVSPEDLCQESKTGSSSNNESSQSKPVIAFDF